MGTPQLNYASQIYALVLFVQVINLKWLIKKMQKHMSKTVKRFVFFPLYDKWIKYTDLYKSVHSSS
jgi:hypothetical protein